MLRRSLAIVLAVGVFVGAFAVRAESDYSAPSCEVLNARWPQYRKHFHLIFGGQFSSKRPFACPSQMSKLAETFYLLEKLRWRPVAGKRAPDFYAWLGKTLKHVEYSPAAHANAMTHFPAYGKTTIFKPFFDRPLYQRAAVLIHEARHLQGDYPHLACEGGSEKGQANCDAHFSVDGSGGAYSYGFSFMLWLANGSNYPRAERGRIRELLAWELHNRYNDVSETEASRLRSELLGTAE